MFKIQDGRDKFYQWDLNRKLIVEDSSITQVHFSNAIYTTALVCEVIDGIVNVPNIILQDEFDIYVYGYDRDYTKHSATFNVVKRTKPESYVYTETEILNYYVLLDRINELDLSNYYTIPESNEKFATKEEIPSTSGLATEQFVNSKVSGLASENYVNSANSNVLQTISQNYALKTEIPSTTGFATEEFVNEAVSRIDIPEVDLSGYQEKLTAGDNITIEGNVISATCGSGIELELNQLKGDLANKLSKSPTDWEQWTAEEQAAARERIGIPGDYELIERFTMTEAGTFDRNSEPDGTPYNFKKLLVYREYPDTVNVSEASGWSQLYFFNSKGNFIKAECGMPSKARSSNFSFFENDHNISIVKYSRTYLYSTGLTYLCSKPGKGNGWDIEFGNCVRVVVPSSDTEPTGTIVEIYGVRA